MIGMLQKDCQIKANIPNKDRSLFSQERYQFFLDAPFEISSKCCDVMKKAPFHKYQKETGRTPMSAQMASESRLRTQKWIQNGCNGFDLKNPISNPMAFWTEQDVLLYIYKKHDELIEWRKSEYRKMLSDLSGRGLDSDDAVDAITGLTVAELLERDITSPIASVYGEVVKDKEIEGQMDLEDVFGKELFDLDRPTLKTTGCNRTGCMFCGFGCHLEKPGEGRFEKMKVTHPKQYEYIMKSKEEGGLNYKDVIDWINENGNLNIRY